MKLFIFVVFSLLILIWGVKSESRNWNNGISPYDGSEWKFFDRDSQGGRGYVDQTGNYVWISWPVDKHKSRLRR